MGGGPYSANDRSIRAENLGYYDKPIEQVFKQKELHLKMNPKGVAIRESRDLNESSKSIAIILGLDVTGSMDYIPHNLIQNGLPTIMKNIMDLGVEYPQLLFIGIGDHKCDRGPLQIGQFETSDELLDFWLTHTWLEKGGGGNGGESYGLAHYFID